MPQRASWRRRYLGRWGDGNKVYAEGARHELQSGFSRETEPVGDLLVAHAYTYMHTTYIHISENVRGREKEKEIEILRNWLM